MYEIERKQDQVIIRREGRAVYTTSVASFIVHQSETGLHVSKVKDLTDEQLLLALANAVPLKMDTDFDTQKA